MKAKKRKEAKKEEKAKNVEKAKNIEKAEKADKGQEKDKMKQVSFLYKISMFLYKQASIHKLPLFSSGQVERDLIRLYPVENIHCLKTEYYVKKLSVSIAVILLGMLLAGTAKIRAESKVRLQEDGTFPRSSYLEGQLDILMEAQMEQGTQEFQLQIWPRRLSAEETDMLADDFLEQLPLLIAGTNESLQSVTQNLQLKEEYPEFPFHVEWESSRPELLSVSGTVVLPEEPAQAKLLVRLIYEDYVREESISVTLRPPDLTEEERIHRDLEEYLIAAEQESRQEEIWNLPNQWEGRQIIWRQRVESHSLVLCAASIAAALAVYLLSDRDLHSQLEKRRRKLKLEYPDLVHQLALFIGAGMTVRGAFQRLAADYERKREKTAQRLPAYEEVLHACRELQSGVSEGAVYEHFGQRTGMREYIRLSTLLMQNLKRGSSTLLERLREEVDKASEEKLMQSRQLGEEAGTKLLVPMVLMLAIVMVMIMIPAFATV